MSVEHFGGWLGSLTISYILQDIKGLVWVSENDQIAALCHWAILSLGVTHFSVWRTDSTGEPLALTCVCTERPFYCTIIGSEKIHEE